ncbi:unnamed protein product [Symbiodinium microadriaticum]|nr:unnamed protein product [Symbiodinium microadriaticum]
MAGAWTNLAGVELSLGCCESAEAHCRKALELEPDSREAVMNLANALRNLGRRREAVEAVWERILHHESQEGEKKERPTPLKLAGAEMDPGPEPSLVVACLKWGKRYSSVYVNRLWAASRRHLRMPSRFVCFTEDPAGLDDSIEVRPLPASLPLWWGKAYLFSEEAGLDGNRVLFLDLDQVILGDLDPLAAYSGAFALLGTEDVACELALGGYNSSVICWRASPFFRQLYDCLSPSVLRFVHRFDHWLEMMVEDADRWQNLLPGKILDYTTVFRDGVCLGCETDDSSFAVGSTSEEKEVLNMDDPPAGCAIVTFPRSPKPHEVVELHDWVRRHWGPSLDAAEAFPPGQDLAAPEITAIVAYAAGSLLFLSIFAVEPLNPRVKRQEGYNPARFEEKMGWKPLTELCQSRGAAPPSERETVRRADWLHAFWARNYDALVIVSVLRNVQQNVDETRKWLDAQLRHASKTADWEGISEACDRLWATTPASEACLVDCLIEVLFYEPADRQRYRADSLVALIMDEPPGPFDFTVVSAMGVITEGAKGTEMAATYTRLKQTRGVEVIRADTATLQSVDYNAACVERAVRENVRTPWGWVGYSQGCANAFRAEAMMLQGTPEQQRLMGNFRCRQLLYSAANGSAHATCGDWKLLRALVDGERFLKRFQASMSAATQNLALDLLQNAMSSRLAYAVLGSVQSLTHQGARTMWRDGQHCPRAPSTSIRGVVEEHTIPDCWGNALFVDMFMHLQPKCPPALARSKMLRPPIAAAVCTVLLALAILRLLPCSMWLSAAECWSIETQRLAPAMEQSDAEQPPPAKVVEKKKRFHEFDWFRAIMVILVVYAHISRSGVPGGVQANISPDNRIYTDENPSPFAVRWISEVRQYCLPLLFYVSGAASACSFKQAPSGFGKIAVYTFLGVALNGVLWVMGPQNPECDPGSGPSRPECKGAVFDFTVSPWSGKLFPILFQMWYCVMLIALMLINWPLFAYLHQKRCHVAILGVQLVATTGLITAFVLLAGDEMEQPFMVASLKVVSEALFLAAAVLTRPEYRPTWLPLRLIHYVLGFIMFLAFGCAPIAPRIERISAGFILYIFTGFNKSFQLGFIITLSRLPGREEALPIVSTYWPLLVLLRTLTAPSTSWFAGGNLTYPYYPRLVDRGLYAGGAVVVMLVVDRVGRHIDCKALPASMANMALLLYLLHPWIMAVLIVATRGTSMEDAGSLWLLSLVVGSVLGLCSTIQPRRVCKKDRDEKSLATCNGDSESSSSSQEDAI